MTNEAAIKQLKQEIAYTKKNVMIHVGITLAAAETILAMLEGKREER